MFKAAAEQLGIALCVMEHDRRINSK